MKWMMEAKESAWAKHKAAGDYHKPQWKDFSKKRTGKDVIKCTKGKAEAVKGDASQTYKCKNIVSLDKLHSS